jgi:hypothetical protein
LSPLGELEEGLPQIGDEPLRGFRKWVIRDGDLRSLNGVPWPHREPLVAMCADGIERQIPHDAPVRGCTCGHYAAKSLALLADAGYALTREQDMAFGSVKLWGRIVPHARGYRAQFAYPELVIVRDPLVARLIERHYGCEVMLADDATPHDTKPAATSAAAAGPIIEAALQYGLACNLNLNIEGRCYMYGGALDPIAVGRWFAGVIAQVATDSAVRGTIGHQLHTQIMTHFYKP